MYGILPPCHLHISKQKNANLEQEANIDKSDAIKWRWLCIYKPAMSVNTLHTNIIKSFNERYRYQLVDYESILVNISVLEKFCNWPNIFLNYADYI